MVLQLGAKNDLRRWPVENFAALAQGLLQEGVAVALVGSPNETALGERLKEHLGQAAEALHDWMGRTSLPQLAALLAQSDLVVSADTGTLHLATAVAPKVLGLYMGPAQAHETGPYGPGHLVLQARGDCGPCQEHNPVCNGEAPCRRLIRTSEVLAACRSLLAGATPDQAGDLTLLPEVKALVGEFDRFGQYYRYIEPQPLTLEHTLALGLRQVGRAFLRPGQPLDSPAEILRGWLPIPEKERQAVATLHYLAGQLGPKLAAKNRAACRKIKAEAPALGPLADQVDAFPTDEPIRACNALIAFFMEAAKTGRA